MTNRRPRGGQVLAATLLAVIATLLATAAPASASADTEKDQPAATIEVSLL